VRSPPGGFSTRTRPLSARDQTHAKSWRAMKEASRSVVAVETPLVQDQGLRLQTPAGRLALAGGLVSKVGVGGWESRGTSRAGPIFTVESMASTGAKRDGWLKAEWHNGAGPCGSTGTFVGTKGY